MNNNEEVTHRGSGLALFAILIIFVGLAWSFDLTTAVARAEPGAAPTTALGWAFLLVDVGLLGLLLLLTLRLHQILLGRRDWHLLRWWGGAAGSVLALSIAELLVAPGPDEVPAPGTWGAIFSWVAFLVGQLVWVAAFGILFAATVGASPWRVLTRTGRRADPDAWRRVLPAVPLLVGTYLTFVAAGGIWYWLDLSAIRSVAEATEVASRRGSTGPVEDLCVGAIAPEYFAQLSQVIPLLLVALGIERRFFERLMREPVQRALTVFTVLLLCVGEAAAVAIIAIPNRGCGRVAAYWQEYVAFGVTLLASSIALATLLWALVAVSPTDGDKPSAGLSK